MNEIADFLADPRSQWIWGAAQSIFIAVGFIFVIKQIRLARDQNSITHLNYFRDLWNSDGFLRARIEFADSPVDSESGLLAHEDLVVTFMNDLGLAVRAGQANKEHVWSYFGYYVESYWLLLGKKVHHFRKHRGDENFFKNFEELNNTLRAIGIQRNSPALAKEHGDVFRREEKLLAEFLRNKDLALATIGPKGTQ